MVIVFSVKCRCNVLLLPVSLPSLTNIHLCYYTYLITICSAKYIKELFLYRIATIKQTLGLNTEAIEEYKKLLIKEPSYVPALKGLHSCLVVFFSFKG